MQKCGIFPFPSYSLQIIQWLFYAVKCSTLIFKAYVHRYTIRLRCLGSFPQNTRSIKPLILRKSVSITWIKPTACLLLLKTVFPFWRSNISMEQHNLLTSSLYFSLPFFKTKSCFLGNVPVCFWCNCIITCIFCFLIRYR